MQVATGHLKPICYNMAKIKATTNDVATGHLKPICYNCQRLRNTAEQVATGHLKPICYNRDYVVHDDFVLRLDI